MVARDIDKDLLDYYRHYCEMTIWFRKIVLRSNPNQYITIQDITAQIIEERNRILIHVPRERRKLLRKELNSIATSYYHKISHWSRKQKITIDMV